MVAKKRLTLAKPPKPVLEMTDDERKAFAAKIYDAMKNSRNSRGGPPKRST